MNFITNSTPNLTQLSIQLTSELLTRHSLSVLKPWLDSFLSTIRTPPPPLPALTSTAHFRLLNSDFTQSLNSNPSSLSSPSPTLPSSTFPSNITDVTIKSTTLQSNIPVQVLSIEDVGSSKYTQIESIERVERGEEIRGREVIRSIPGMNEDDSNDGVPTSTSTGGTANGTNAPTATVKRSNGPHKLLLQDAAGTKIYGFELGKVPKVFMTMTVEDGGMCIGCKVLIKKGAVVRRGMVMMNSENVVVLGGKVDAWDKVWRAGRKERLKAGLLAGVEG